MENENEKKTFSFRLFEIISNEIAKEEMKQKLKSVTDPLTWYIFIKFFPYFLLFLIFLIILVILESFIIIKISIIQEAIENMKKTISTLP